MTVNLRRILQCSALISGIFGSSLLADAQMTDLDWFVGRGLAPGQISEQRRHQLERILGISDRSTIVGPSPWYVWKTPAPGKAQYAVLLIQSVVINPGLSSARIVLFDNHARRIHSWRFGTGDRMTPTSVSVEPAAGLDAVIVLNMFRLGGRDIAKEFFFIDNDHLRIIRLEDSKGAAVQNEYVYASWQIGVVPTAKTVDEWAAMLASPNKVDVLSALVFLGGRHITEPRRRYFEPNGSKYAPLFRELIDNPRIHDLIIRLTQSDDEWIRQAAILASRSPDDRPLD